MQTRLFVAQIIEERERIDAAVEEDRQNPPEMERGWLKTNIGALVEELRPRYGDGKVDCLFKGALREAKDSGVLSTMEPLLESARTVHRAYLDNAHYDRGTNFLEQHNEAVGAIIDRLDLIDESSKIAAAPTQSSDRKTATSWGDIGIAIDSERKCWQFSPCPKLGSRVAKKDGSPIPLSGERWRVLLNALSKSEYGNTASFHEIIVGMNWIMPGTSSSDQVHDAGLKETVNASLKQLKDMIRDLRRQIRNAVTGPSETSNPLEVDDKRHVVISGFTVRHLLNGNQFGARPA